MSVTAKQGGRTIELKSGLLLQMLLGVESPPFHALAKHNAVRYVNSRLPHKSEEKKRGLLLVERRPLFECVCGRCGRQSPIELAFREPMTALDETQLRCASDASGVTAVYGASIVVVHELFGPRIAIAWADLFNTAVLEIAKNANLQDIIEPVDVERRRLILT